jgi:hypothetical protein
MTAELRSYLRAEVDRRRREQLARRVLSEADRRLFAEEGE